MNESAPSAEQESAIKQLMDSITELRLELQTTALEQVRELLSGNFIYNPITSPFI